MAGEKEELPIRRLAARFLFKNEQDGLDAIDRVTSSLYGKIRLLYVASYIGSSVLFGFFVLFSLFLALVDPSGRHFGHTPFFINVAIGIVAIAAFFSWRIFQYGFSYPIIPRKIMHGNGDEADVRNLERFFEAMQKEQNPRAYYCSKNGTRTYINRRYLFGSLRLLLLSEHHWVREPVSSLGGLSFGRELFIETNAEEWIKQANRKPKAGGRSVAYDYQAILLALIEHPALARIIPGERGAITQLIKLIHTVSESRPDYPDCLPERTQLQQFASSVLEAIKKNRAS
ncbi:hypothetical protein [Acetobacter sp. P1H12_c]|uniref:hypothetical protein n=1 Tax=Acetobacter sp. P1H12_c TaxID=2762621 RepID=UPI001C0564D4|nr:hypothetical protein [Acetobacter sp. P1H12_c]